MVIAIELGVVLVVAFADDKHDVLASERACIYCHVLYACD